MNTHNLSQSIPSSTAANRTAYQKLQVAGLVAPFVDALSRKDNLDTLWAETFPFDEMTHPSRPTLKLSVVIHRAEREAAVEHMRVDSLESARSVLVKAGNYSDWTEKSYAPLLELLDIAIANKRTKR